MRTVISVPKRYRTWLAGLTIHHELNLRYFALLNRRKNEYCENFAVFLFTALLI